MTTNGMTITHKLEAHGTGTLKASQLAALAGLVPDEARINSKNESHRNESAWTWTATWDHAAELARLAALVSQAPEAGHVDVPPPLLLEPGFPNGEPRCQVVSGVQAAAHGFEPYVQCRRKAGHSTLRNIVGHDFPKAAKQ